MGAVFDTCCCGNPPCCGCTIQQEIGPCCVDSGTVPHTLTITLDTDCGTGYSGTLTWGGCIGPNSGSNCWTGTVTLVCLTPDTLNNTNVCVTKTIRFELHCGNCIDETWTLNFECPDTGQFWLCPLVSLNCSPFQGTFQGPNMQIVSCFSCVSDNFANITITA